MNRIFILILAVFINTQITAEELTDIQISSPIMDKALIKNEAIEVINTRNAVDGGDLLKSINGINTIRRGGHGLEAIIRGQNAQRLNTFMDGAMVYGACASKMDPGSTYANVNNYDTVTVIKGTQSVIYGAGGPGGIISFKRVTDPVSDNSYKVTQTFDSNAGGYTSAIDAIFGISENSYFRINSSSSNAGNYETGSGIKPLTEYQTVNHAFILGKRLSDGSKVELTYQYNQQDEVGYPGLKMDIAYSDTDMVMFKYHRQSPISIFSSMNFELFNSEIDHQMDDFTLRGRTAMDMFTTSTSDTYGGRLIGNIGTDIRAGVDYENNTKNANQNMEMSNTNMLMAYSWPDVEIDKLGFFIEKDSKDYSYGLRYDYVEAQAHKATVDTGSMNANQKSANELYTQDYGSGVVASKREFDNFSGFIRLDRPLANGKSYISFSVNERSPDATELFNAKSNGTAMMRHIGNPNLSSERHTTFEIGFNGPMMGSQVDLSVYHNDVSDFITTHRKDDSGMKARLYKNIDATLYGYELSIQKNLMPGFDAQLNLNYTKGEDDTQNRPLPQIMPLAGSFTLEKKSSTTNYGLRINFADTQDNFDSKVLDVGRTAGYTTYDIFSGFEPTPNIRVSLGVSNLTDKRYSTHLNATNTLDSAADRTDEPGRSFFGSIQYEF